ncbi:MAG: hypothetical protein PQJ61_14375 [Spirochaetales bacterium]|uniref:Uncharacterized protein n=1 Tax=Candidatus Thalassospirochaeta sargassi TaxID=3119039 RepID=A0AAJ1IEU3_9SPIO|nr:hypothetical protein [Spirochaetales bacterium]
MGKAADTVKLYLTQLEDKYNSLNRILLLEAEDISKTDEKKLLLHAGLEKETVESIISLTKSVYTYMEKLEVDNDSVNRLKNIDSMKKKAQTQISANIKQLKASMKEIEHKINRIKLPQSTRRVYYSGNNPTIMDIEI